MSKEKPTPLCLIRMKNEIETIRKELCPGIFVHVDEKDILKIHSLVVGPENTPYFGGFFYVVLTIPPRYPFDPPQVRLMTGEEGTVLFNPDLYSYEQMANIHGIPWSMVDWDVLTKLSCVLVSVRSLMTEKPLFNVAGYKERETGDRDSCLFNEIILHETLRVAVCDMMEGKIADSLNFPKPLADIMEKKFCKLYDYYETTAQSKAHYTGTAMKNPLLKGRDGGEFNYSVILKRLREIKRQIEKANNNPQ